MRKDHGPKVYLLVFKLAKKKLLTAHKTSKYL